MPYRSLFMTSVAAILVTSGAKAADAIVASEPEAVEYVRLCDAYGTGYFYIPGTETCLKIEGYIRFQVNVAPNASGNSDFDAFTRGQVQFTAKSDTEYGPLTGLIVMQTNADNASVTATNSSHLDSAYLDIAGFRAGLFYSWWDDSLSGETDDIKSSITLHNSLRYQYQSGTFYAGLSVDELEDYSKDPNDVGIAFGIGGKTGALGFQVTGGYDTDAEEGAVRAMATIAAGPGTIGLAAVYSSNPNAYYSAAQWAVAAEYAIKVTDKLKLTPGFQYYGDYRANAARTDFGPGNAWKAGITIDYQIADNLYAKASVQYLDPDVGTDVTSGYFRLQRAF